jgi:hypothetical protein
VWAVASNNKREREREDGELERTDCLRNVRKANEDAHRPLKQGKEWIKIGKAAR